MGIFPKDSEIVFKKCVEETIPFEILLTEKADDIEIENVDDWEHRSWED